MIFPIPLDIGLSLAPPLNEIFLLFFCLIFVVELLFLNILFKTIGISAALNTALGAAITNAKPSLKI